MVSWAGAQCGLQTRRAFARQPFESASVAPFLFFFPLPSSSCLPSFTFLLCGVTHPHVSITVSDKGRFTKNELQSKGITNNNTHGDGWCRVGSETRKKKKKKRKQKNIIKQKIRREREEKKRWNSVTLLV